jgi:hypothetical protein
MAVVPDKQAGLAVVDKLADRNRSWGERDLAVIAAAAMAPAAEVAAAASMVLPPASAC